MKWILHRENRCQELLKRTSSSKRGASFRTRFLNFFLFFSMSIYSREDTFPSFFFSLSFFLLLDFFKRYVISFFSYVLLLSIIFVSQEMWFLFFFFFCALIMESMSILRVLFSVRSGEKYCVTLFEMLRIIFVTFLKG